MNWILRLAGIILLTSGIIFFFLSSPYWWLSIVSFVLLLGIVFSSIISDIADLGSKIISEN